MSPEAAPEAEAPAPLRIETRDVAAAFFVLNLFLITQLVAVLLIEPFRASNVQGFEDPTDYRNGLWLLLTVLVFTFLILWVARRGYQKIIQGLILGSVGMTLIYVFFPLLDRLPTTFFDTQNYIWAGYSWPFSWAVVVAAAPAVLLTWLLYRFPEWYIVDAVGIGVSAAVITVFGRAGFTPVTYLIVLVLFAVYDYWSVYKTKHMLTLADKVLDLHLPIMFVVPKTADYSFLEEGARAKAAAEGLAPKKPRDAVFVGLGDVVIPSILGVAAVSQYPHSWAAAFGTFIGVAAGLLALLYFVLRGRPHAGLPLLNSGAFVGFLAGLWLEQGTLVFW